MEAVWLRFRSEWRGRGRAWLALALLIGLAAGAVTALAAGARRTDSAYHRLVVEHQGVDATVANVASDGTAIFDFDEIARLPMVADAVRGKYGFTKLGTDVGYIAPVENRIGSEIARFKLLHGRAPRPDRPEEVAVPFLLADRFDIRVGDRFDLIGPDELAFASPAVRAEVDALLRHFPDGKMLVVGIEAAPGEFPPQRVEDLSLHLTPAFAKLVKDSPDEILVVRLRRGARDFPAFLRALQARSHGQPVQVQDMSLQAGKVQDAMRVQALAWGILALVLGFAALLLTAQLLARQAVLEARENEVLAALGTTRRQRTAVALARAAATGLLGAAIGVTVALLASPLFPTSLARTAEPEPGFAVDPAPLILGAAITFVAVVALAAPPAWRAARTETRSRLTAPARRSRVAAFAARLGASPPVTTGLDFALEPGRGSRAVPVRSSIGALLVVVTTLTAALTFGASVDHLLESPHLYGLTWDLTLTRYGYGGPLDRSAATDAHRVAGVVGVGVGDVGIPSRVNGALTDLLALSAETGVIAPPLFEGRAPRRADEIALSTKTMNAAGARTGATVSVGAVGGRGHRFRVVGRTFVPYSSNGGGWITLEGERVLAADFARAPVTAEELFLRLAPGASPKEATANLNRFLREDCRRDRIACPDGPVDLGSLTASRPDDVVNYGRVQGAPRLLAVVLVVLGAGTLAFLLATAVRRRRRELAILKALGTRRRQAGGAVEIQALTIALIALVMGTPLGVAAGRATWSWRAHALGIANEPVVPWLALAVVAGATIAGALLLAALPAWSAAHTRAAVELRSE